MEIKLTKADKIILKAISHNPRILEKELAKKCNLSKDSIRYRINRLEKLKIILGYGFFIDYAMLGYNSYKLYLKLNATTKQKLELRDFLGQQKHVFSIFESNGNWDIATAIFAKTRKEYYNFENKLLLKFGNIISSKKFCLMLDAIVFNNNFLLDNNKIEEFIVWNPEKTETIDEKDKIIIHELHKNSRESLVNLAEKASLSIDSTSKRIKKLRDKKIIGFYHTDIDYNLLGFEKYKLFIYVKKYSEDFEKNLFNYFRSNKNTSNIIKMIGPWKIELEFLIKEHNAFEKIISELQEKFSDYILKLDFSIFRNEVWHPSENLLI